MAAVDDVAALAAAPGQSSLLSPAEEVLAIPYLSQRSVMSFLTQQDALPLRAASRACRDAVAEHAWGADMRGADMRADCAVVGSLASWRRCFPKATHANVSFRATELMGSDLQHLRGLKMLWIMFGREIT